MKPSRPRERKTSVNVDVPLTVRRSRAGGMRMARLIPSITGNDGDNSPMGEANSGA